MIIRSWVILKHRGLLSGLQLAASILPYATIVMMFELPLFPLNTVLFPGMPLHLHIFEDRYKRMMEAVLQGDQTFGVALIRHGVEALGGMAEPYEVGCSARIISSQPVGKGRLNILAIGRERFRIRHTDTKTQPYMLGWVDHLPLLPVDPAELAPLARRVRSRAKRYLERISDLIDIQRTFSELPDENLPMLYIAAILLQAPMIDKQGLLEVDSALSLAAQLDAVYARELALLDSMNHSTPLLPGGFSVN